MRPFGAPVPPPKKILGADGRPAPDIGPQSWVKFDPMYDPAFKMRLHLFRDNTDLDPSPGLRGGEGQLFLSRQNPSLALKRWFKNSLGKKDESVERLRSAEAAIERNPKLSAEIEVVHIYQEGPDWILRDFDPQSVALRGAGPQANEARNRAIAQLQALQRAGNLKEPLDKILLMLKQMPPNANLHWSRTKSKILVIDML